MKKIFGLTMLFVIIGSAVLGCISSPDAKQEEMVSGIRTYPTFIDFTKSEKSGIFSEKVIGNTKPVQFNPMTLNHYSGVYNDGNEISVGYVATSPGTKTELVKFVKFYSSKTYESYSIFFDNEKPVEYSHRFTYYNEEGDSIDETIYWDENGRIDPRSDGNIEEANEFIDFALKKGRDVKERFFAKELGDW